MDYEKFKDAVYLVEIQRKLGTLCYQLCVDNPIDEHIIAELLPYMVEYISRTQSKEQFKKCLFVNGDINGSHIVTS